MTAYSIYIKSYKWMCNKMDKIEETKELKSKVKELEKELKKATRNSVTGVITVLASLFLLFSLVLEKFEYPVILSNISDFLFLFLLLVYVMIIMNFITIEQVMKYGHIKN